MVLIIMFDIKSIMKIFDKRLLQYILLFISLLVFKPIIYGEVSEYRYEKHPTLLLYDKELRNKIFKEKNIPDHIKFSKKSKIKPKIGISSHHLLVYPIIDEYFKHLSKLKPNIKNFIIISPCHFDQGFKNISLSSLSWDMGSDIIKVNRKYCSEILNSLKIREDRRAFHMEHGIYALLPFIKKYFPHSKIIPILLKQKKIDLKKIAILKDSISKILTKDKNSFLLMSIDFSHHAGKKITETRDKKNIFALKNIDTESYNRIWCDNTTGIKLMYKIIRDLKLNQSSIFCHTDGSKYLNKNLEDITSYFWVYIY